MRAKLADLEKKHSDLRSTMQEEAGDLVSCGRRIVHLKRALFFARSRISASCVAHRNSLSIGAVKGDYETTLREMGREPNKQLQVFPVSATVYLWYQMRNNSHVQHELFPNREDTQIPALRDWLMSTTLDNRERCAQAFLDDVDVFLASVQPWLVDSSGDGKMSVEVKKFLEPQVRMKVDELEAVCLFRFKM